jgi:hypothetical protein
MSPLDLDAAAPLFRALREAHPNSGPYFDMLSSSLIWLDELPKADPAEWGAIRPVLRHRICVILQEPSEYTDWWNRAKRLFPEWVGFRPGRCEPTPELVRIFREGEAEAIRSVKDFSEEPPWAT